MKRILLGRWGEQVARDYLLSKGWRLIEQNYRCPLGELDLIMWDGRWLVFVEVRTRTSDRWGRGEETIDFRKQKRLLRVASHFLAGYRGRPGDLRFDLVSILKQGEGSYELTHLPGIITP
ncbi:MAG: YraN family protein [Heliobacteriaceae bacterium]|nr:YraN family protein [Heliobacteriaceae bacterium]MDD4587050.1 YraN family protein [Heliobacteriaceae bacterium]